MSSEHFISRWSRRKQEIRKAEQPAEGAPPAQADPVGAERASEAASLDPEDGRTAQADGELSADEIALLPSIEELTAETNLAMFLRKGVPEPLRKAALRRMWSLDPKIRDYVSEAREYAYDWNTPGGVPGFGPIGETADEVARMVARIVGGGGSDESGEQQDEPSALSQDREQPSAPALAENSTRGPDSPDPLPQSDSFIGTADHASLSAPLAKPVDKTSDETAALRQGHADEPATVASPRRHGGALPL